MAEGQENRDNEENEHPQNLINISAPNGGISLDMMVEAYAQEYENLDHTLDEIDSWMTKLEQQNDSLNAQLDELLESSRQARKELQEVKESENVESDAPKDTSSSNSNNQKEND